MVRKTCYISRLVMVAGLILCAAQVAFAQLNENCTVSVLNRTVRVNSDGSWVLPNIPANFGQVKARATCVQNGVTTAGESDFFTVTANGAVNLPSIILGNSTQVPVSLSVAPGTPSLSTLGQTLQLVVTATYPDNSTRDVSAAGSGTNYTTSNPAIVTVSANGLLTAVANGTVVIQATNDGATGIVTAKVVISGVDSDGDRIPDDAEIRLGLDPHNPVDAQEDFDRDNLTNLQEFLLGTDIRKADTDGDGLSDESEVNTHNTNPLLADTDGDLIPDGIEIQTSTNSLDRNSYDLKKATATSALIPVSFVLTTSVLFPVISQQLNWKVNLIDGKTTLDLTNDSRTSYVSSDLTVCSFGTNKGEVFAGNPGNCVITIANNTLSGTVPGSVRSFTPTALSFITIPGYANNVDVRGNNAFVAAGAAGLQVVNVTHRQVPRIVGSLDTPGNANDVRVVGNRAYIADGAAGLQIIDVSDPVRPALLGSVDTPGEAQDVVVSGTRAYVADGASGLQIIDVSNPSAPAILGSLDTPGIAKGVDVSGTFAVVADGAPSNSVRIIDVTTAASPQSVGSVSIPGDVKDLVVRNTQAYVVALTGGLQIVNFSTPTIPQIVGGIPGSDAGVVPRDVELSGNFAFAAEQLFPNAVPIVDVTSAANPIFRTTINFAPLGDYAGTGIAVDSQFVYMTGEFFIVGPENGTTGNTRLFIGQYREIEDNLGVPPTVQITSPASGTQVIQGSTVTVTASAVDDVGVDSVSLFANGQLVSTTSGTPYQFTFTAPTTGSTLTLGATALDFGNNVGQAPNVTLNLIPDPGTTVNGRVIDANQNVVSGATVTVTGGLTTTSRGDGTFSISGVPMRLGNLVVTASKTVEGLFLSGSSAPVPPVRGGTTNVGDIVIVASRKAIVASTTGSVHILDISNLSIESTVNLGGDLNSVAVTPDGATAVITSFGASSVTFIDLLASPPTTTGTVTTPIRAEDIAISCAPICFALVTGGEDSNRIVSVDIAGKRIASTLNLLGNATGITTTPAGQVLINSSSTNTIRIASLSSTGILSDTGVSVSTGSNSRPNDVTVSPNGRLALVANFSSNSIGVLAIAANGEVSFVKSIPAFTRPQSIAFSPDGTRAYVLLIGGRVGVVNIDAANNVTDSGIRITTLNSATAFFGVNQIAVTNGGKVLARFVGKVVVIDANTNTVIGTITIPDQGRGGGIAIIP